MADMQSEFPELGFGLGLRPRHYPHIFEHWPQVGWFEIISENFMDTDGRPKRNLARICERYPVVMHGVALSIGGADPLNLEYLSKLQALAQWLEPAWVSDHLCWTGVAHNNSHDLLPMPYTKEALKHVVSRIVQVQDYLQRPIALENPSTYLEFKTSVVPEAEFIAEMVRQSGCRLLLDVNNVYVTCYNHRLDPKRYIDSLPLDTVAQIHLSGHTNKGTHIIDTHDDHVVDEVWSLYRYVVHKAKRTPNTMVEWDDHIPEWDVLDAELAKAREAARTASGYAPLPELEKAQQPYIANRQVALGEAQALMQDAIISGGREGSAPDSWIRAKKEFASEDQLAVYVNAYRFRLRDATAEDYPVLKTYLGDERFSMLMQDFVRNTPSVHFNIGRYPARLPDFLARHMPEDVFAHELAGLENAIVQLGDPQETAPLALEDLAGMTPERFMDMILQPRRALELFTFSYPVNRYYCAVKEQTALPEPLPEKTYLAVFRHEDIVWRMDLERYEHHLLQKLFAGVCVGQALGETQSELGLSEEVLVPRLSEWFARWMRNGLLARNGQHARTEEFVAL